MYKTAKPGQVIYYGKNFWEPRREVVFVRYYKDNKYLLHPNTAVVEEGGIQMSVDIKDIYRKPE